MPLQQFCWAFYQGPGLPTKERVGNWHIFLSQVLDFMISEKCWELKRKSYQLIEIIFIFFIFQHRCKYRLQINKIQ